MIVSMTPKTEAERKRYHDGWERIFGGEAVCGWCDGTKTERDVFIDESDVMRQEDEKPCSWCCKEKKG